MPTLGDIRTKVRRLTRNPSPSQLTDQNIDDYVNTFILYDLPEHLRLFALRQTLTFYTNPGQDVYETNTIAPLDPLYDFKNVYMSVHPPVYVAGYQTFFSQSREQFFGVYPMASSIVTIGTGDGVLFVFAGTLDQIPVIANNVQFNSIDANGNGLVAIDNGVGGLINPSSGVFAGNINYTTGVYNVIFAAPPAVGAAINAQTYPYVAARPTGVLYYNYQFTVRPVPDQVYPINVEVYRRPTALLAAGTSPLLEQWWQYIAYGASKKVFEDRADMEGVQVIMPEFKRQEILVLRNTIVQQSNVRTATIFTEQSFGGFGWGSF